MLNLTSRNFCVVYNFLFYSKTRVYDSKHIYPVKFATNYNKYFKNSNQKQTEAHYRELNNGRDLWTYIPPPGARKISIAIAITSYNLYIVYPFFFYHSINPYVRALQWQISISQYTVEALKFKTVRLNSSYVIHMLNKQIPTSPPPLNTHCVSYTLHNSKFLSINFFFLNRLSFFSHKTELFYAFFFFDLVPL